ncbi:MAG: hypothetical protein RSB72_02960 [Bacilli bacterium]
MKNIIDFIKDKSYYFLGITVLLIIIVVIISSCSLKSNSNSYLKIENKMVLASKEYYSNRKSKLPKNGEVKKVTINTLVETKLLKKVLDPKNKNNVCQGFVEVKKVDNDYSYIPFLTCKDNYEPEYLNEKIKLSKVDEYGNGIYPINSEYIFRGDEVKNYVMFNKQLWRIIKVDSAGDIELILAKRTDDYYEWDTSYNVDMESSVGKNDSYFNAEIRKTLVNYYNTNFTTDSKAKIVSKDLCVAKSGYEDNYDVSRDCSVLQKGEKIGLLKLSDYKIASLDSSCNKISDHQCINSNYFSDENISTWLLNAFSKNSYKVFYLSGNVSYTSANASKKLNPVIYLTHDAITVEGVGTQEKPYIIK